MCGTQTQVLTLKTDTTGDHNGENTDLTQSTDSIHNTICILIIMEDYCWCPCSRHALTIKVFKVQSLKPEAVKPLTN